MKCLSTDGTETEVNWKFLNSAWVAAITVCTQRLYTPSPPDVVEEVIELPVVTTDSANAFGRNGQVTGTIISQGSSDIIEYGFVYSQIDPPTIEDSTLIAATESFVGEFSAETGFLTLAEAMYYFRVYARNSEGISYGETISANSYICLIKGTMISLSNGTQKPIEDIEYNDSLLVWNFDEGKFDESKPVWMSKEFTMPRYDIMKFSDGSELGTIAATQGHCIYNIQQNKFTYLNHSDTPVGTTTFNEKERTIELIGSETIEKETSFYNIITHSHINLFANGILTSSKLNNIYPINEMKFIKEDRDIRSNKFNVSDEMFNGLRLSEQPSHSDLGGKVAMMVDRMK